MKPSTAIKFLMLYFFYYTAKTLLVVTEAFGRELKKLIATIDLRLAAGKQAAKTAEPPVGS